MGLGSLADVGLRQAREAAATFRTQAKSGVDPIAKRRRDALLSATNDASLQAMVAEAFQAKMSELKGEGKAGRWLSPLETHILPKLGKMSIEDIDQNLLRSVLAPIWHTKADVARKALNRVGIVIRYAAAKGLNVDLLATAKMQAVIQAAGSELSTTKPAAVALTAART